MSDVDPESVAWFSDLRTGTGGAELLAPQLRDVLNVATESAARDQAIRQRDQQKAARAEQHRLDSIREEGAREEQRRLESIREGHEREAHHRRMAEEFATLAKQRRRRSLALHALVCALLGIVLPFVGSSIGESMGGQTGAVFSITTFLIGAVVGAILLISLMVRLLL